MDNKINNKTVAEVVRVEHDESTDAVYLVFEITDERFKQRIKKDWTQDVELVMIGKKLVENERSD